MILFLDDWKRFPSAIADYETTNETFLKMAKVLERLGIENNRFMLALLQPELQGVDPFDPHLTPEQKEMIALEAQYNPWYVFRELTYIPSKGGGGAVRFKLNRANMCLIWLFFLHIAVFLMQPRQTGKTVSTHALSCGLLHFWMKKASISLITKSDDLRQEAVQGIKDIKDEYPKYTVVDDRTDAANQSTVTYNLRETKYRTSVGQNSESGANKIGRGNSFPIMHIDEPPFIPFIAITLPAALASGTTARDQAARNNMPWGTIFTTTAGKIDDRDGKYMYEVYQDAAIWTEQWYDLANRDRLVEVIDKAAPGDMLLVNATFSHLQLGYDDKWLFEAMAAARSKGEDAERDFLNRWTSGTQKSPLSAQLNAIIAQSVCPVNYHEIFSDGYTFRWYHSADTLIEKLETGQFTMGLDTSDAIGRDAIAAVMIDNSDLSVVGAGTFNETLLVRFSAWLGRFLIKYRNVTLVPEKKSSCQAIVDQLLVQLPLAGEDPFRRIYNRIVEDQNTMPEVYRTISQDLLRRGHDFYDQYKGYFGFNTGARSRDELYSSVLHEAAKSSGHLIRDTTLSGEIRGLTVKNGRIDHTSKGHDDHVMAWLLAHWFLRKSRNLDHYGIDTAYALSCVSDQARSLSAQEIRQRAEEKQIFDRIEGIFTEMKMTEDVYLLTKLEHQLRTLNGRLVKAGAEPLSVDGMLKQARDERRRKMRQGSVTRFTRSYYN